MVKLPTDRKKQKAESRSRSRSRKKRKEKKRKEKKRKGKQLMTKLCIASLIAGGIATVLLQLPIIGLVFALIASPLMFAAAELGTTGSHVEIGFAWIKINSALAWAAFITYFSLLYGLLQQGIRWLHGKAKHPE